MPLNKATHCILCNASLVLASRPDPPVLLEIFWCMYMYMYMCVQHVYYTMYTCMCWERHGLSALVAHTCTSSDSYTCTYRRTCHVYSYCVHNYTYRVHTHIIILFINKIVKYYMKCPLHCRCVELSSHHWRETSSMFSLNLHCNR